MMPLPLPTDVAYQLVGLAEETDTIMVVPSSPELLRARLADDGIESSVVAELVVLVSDQDGDRLAAVVDLCDGEAEVVLHWRRDVPALDRLRVPDRLLLRRVTANTLPIQELLLSPETLAEIERSVPTGSGGTEPPPRSGSPPGLMGGSREASDRFPSDCGGLRA